MNLISHACRLHDRRRRHQLRHLSTNVFYHQVLIYNFTINISFSVSRLSRFRPLSISRDLETSRSRYSERPFVISLSRYPVIPWTPRPFVLFLRVRTKKPAKILLFSDICKLFPKKIHFAPQMLLFYPLSLWRCDVMTSWRSPFPSRPRDLEIPIHRDVETSRSRDLKCFLSKKLSPDRSQRLKKYLGGG